MPHHKTIPDILHSAQINKHLDTQQDMADISEQNRQLQGKLKRVEQRLEAALTETRSLIYDLQQRP